jgi:hypothetical protein
MFFRQYQLACLSLYSYLIGDETTGRAVVVDPQRDTSQYLADAEDQGLRIERIFETHFHSDFLSGHLELAAATGAAITFGQGARADFPIEPFADGQLLDDGVVQIHGDALPILQQHQVTNSGVQACILDGLAGGGGETDGELLVDVGEHLGRLFVGQLEVAEHLGPHDHRHAEEGPHLGVVGREAEAVRVFPQVGEPEGPRVADQQTKDAVALGEPPMARCVSPSMPTAMNSASSVRSGLRTPSAS